MSKHFCDYWLVSRRQCRSAGVITAENEHEARFRFCRYHWTRQQDALRAQYGELREVVAA